MSKAHRTVARAVAKEQDLATTYAELERLQRKITEIKAERDAALDPKELFDPKALAEHSKFGSMSLVAERYVHFCDGPIYRVSLWGCAPYVRLDLIQVEDEAGA